MSESPRFQFSLRTLLIIITVSAALLGLLKSFGMLSPTYIIASTFLVVMVCVAHTFDPLSPRPLAFFASKLKAEARVKVLAAEGIRAAVVTDSAFGFRAKSPDRGQIVIDYNSAEEFQRVSSLIR